MDGTAREVNGHDRQLTFEPRNVGRTMMRKVTEEDLPLQCLYRWELERAQGIFLTQPHGGGHVREWTWAEAAGEIRRMAAYLKSRGWEPGTRVGILAKNCAWWIMADLAIWMAGYVSVPIYPSLKGQSIRQILEHSEAKACFIGITDEKEITTTGIPPGVQRSASAVERVRTA